MKEEMKQNITKKQWNELSDEQVQILIKDLKFETAYPWEVITIGRMIEFLGDEIRIEKMNAYGYWVAAYNGCRSPQSELCDSLWNAVKYKLLEEILIANYKL